ncbi:MAG: cation diffusion facilitator family transporter [Gaiellaceae bacterium]
MHPQRRTALVSVAAALALIALKLVTGLVTGSLALLSDAAHSGTDLIAALLTFFAIGYAVRPADVGHPYGHGKVEHLAALAEALFLVGVSAWIARQAYLRLVGSESTAVNAAWYALVVVGIVIAIDASRTIVSWRGARRFHSAALQSNALHFASDFASSTAVLIGLGLVRAGYQKADAVAAIVVAAMVLVAASRLIWINADVLMDRSPKGADAAARAAIAALEPPVELRRLRMREAGGKRFADVVIGVSPGAAVGEGHAAADAVEAAVQHVLRGGDVVVHVEPAADQAELRERLRSAAMSVRGVREVHNLSVLQVGDRTEVSLHLKLPGDLTLERAHAIGSEVERAVGTEMPELSRVQTHLEPLTEEGAGEQPPLEEIRRDREIILQIVRDLTGGPPRGLRFLRTPEGLFAYLTLGLERTSTLAEAHERASEIERRIHERRPEISEVIVHTEP